MVEHRNVDGTGHKQKQIMKTTVVSFFFLREEIGVLHAKDLDTWLCWYKKKKEDKITTTKYRDKAVRKRSKYSACAFLFPSTVYETNGA